MSAFDEDDDEDFVEYHNHAAESPLEDAARWKRALDEQADILKRACEEHEEQRQRILELEDMLEEMEIQRDEAREQLAFAHLRCCGEA